MTHIENLIELYFSAQTTSEQEEELRRLLATTTEDSQTIREAKAVMGYFAVANQRVRKAQQRRRHYSQTIMLAASVALLVGIGCAVTATIWNDRSTQDQCVAYAYGICLTSDEDVLNLMQRDLSNMAAGIESPDNIILNTLSLFPTD